MNKITSWQSKIAEYQGTRARMYVDDGELIRRLLFHFCGPLPYVSTPFQPAKEIFGDDVPWWIKNKAPLQISPSAKSLNLIKGRFTYDVHTGGGGVNIMHYQPIIQSLRVI